MSFIRVFLSQKYITVYHSLIELNTRECRCTSAILTYLLGTSHQPPAARLSILQLLRLNIIIMKFFILVPYVSCMRRAICFCLKNPQEGRWGQGSVGMATPKAYQKPDGVVELEDWRIWYRQQRGAFDIPGEVHFTLTEKCVWYLWKGVPRGLILTNAVRRCHEADWIFIRMMPWETGFI